MLPTRYFQRQSHNSLDSRGKEEEMTISKVHREDFHQDHFGKHSTLHLQSNLLVVPTPRRAEDEEQFDSQRIAKHGFGELPNRHHLPNGGQWNNCTLPMVVLWKETVLLFY